MTDPGLFARMVELASTDDPHLVLGATLELAVDLVDARLGYAALGRPDAPTWWTATAPDGAAIDAVRARVSSGVIEAALSAGKPVVTASAVGDPRFEDRDSVRSHAVSAVACVPLGPADAPGVLYVEGRPGVAFTEGQVRGLADLGRFAAVAAQRAFARVDAGPDPTARWRRALKSEALVGRSPAMAGMLEVIGFAAGHREPVLLLGPTGTGKTAVARVIHDSGPFARRPFVPVDCARLRPDRAEADLFGAVKGAYTGLDHARDGALASAHGGTLFLDEIGELPEAVQAALLVFLNDGVLRPMGSDRARPVTVRIVAATTRECTTLLPPLYYRLAGVVISVPPLSERRVDIPLLARRFAAEVARDGGPAPLLSDAVLEHLVHRDWPGNVRELRQVVTTAALWARHDGAPVIGLAHARRAAVPQAGDDGALAVPDVEDLDEAVRAFSRTHCARIVDRCNGNRSAAAGRLRISRTTLYKLLRP